MRPSHTALLDKAPNTACLAFFIITECFKLFGKTFLALANHTSKFLGFRKMTQQKVFLQRLESFWTPDWNLTQCKTKWRLKMSRWNTPKDFSLFFTWSISFIVSFCKVTVFKHNWEMCARQGHLTVALGTIIPILHMIKVFAVTQELLDFFIYTLQILWEHPHSPKYHKKTEEMKTNFDIWGR